MRKTTSPKAYYTQAAIRSALRLKLVQLQIKGNAIGTHGCKLCSIHLFHNWRCLKEDIEAIRWRVFLVE